jgi:hypothetical protein
LNTHQVMQIPRRTSTELQAAFYSASEYESIKRDNKFIVALLTTARIDKDEHSVRGLRTQDSIRCRKATKKNAIRVVLDVQLDLNSQEDDIAAAYRQVSKPSADAARAQAEMDQMEAYPMVAPVVAVVVEQQHVEASVEQPPKSIKTAPTFKVDATKVDAVKQSCRPLLLRNRAAKQQQPTCSGNLQIATQVLQKQVNDKVRELMRLTTSV